MPSPIASDPAAILIAGPTASGKSGLALALAERIGGMVINADSMQVYAELRILTARPSAEEMARAPHRLYGHARGADGYSAGRYAEDAAGAIAAARSLGRVPIIVGGTGLYFKALLAGLSPIPPIPGDVRARWRARVATEGATALHRILAERDPEMAARLDANDPQRIARALEVLEATGRSLASWQREPGTPVLREEQCVRLVLVPERTELYRRCDARFDQMLAVGALAEVRGLAVLGLDPALPVMRALGVRPLLQHLTADLDQGACPEDPAAPVAAIVEARQRSLAGAVATAKAETRQYAKRQVTWLKRHMMSWRRIETQQMKILEGHSFSFIDFQG